MQKKKFDLTPDIVKVKLEDTEFKKFTKKEEEDKKKNVLLTIAVNPDIRKEFKTWCARNGLKMNEAFLKGFSLLKKQDYI
jgi:hypothetical protein